MNSLAQETSPYLLQHAHNPVDWYAWKPDALARAKAENKMILLSIGYSTCHWCHVMERESFEDPEIAAFMNAHFVCIKVDREERPDVDAIYMEACQVLTGGGGWPLNCFLTPDTRPFYAGTYFPPKPAHQRPAWIQLLQHLVQIWENEPQKAFDQAEKVSGYIQRGDDAILKMGDTRPDPAIDVLPDAQKPHWNLEATFYKLRDNFDRVDGGFGSAPKFPSSMSLQFLLQYHFYTGNEEALEHVLLSLQKMISGGMYDQLGGGFARYSTDREWLVPHFEKMLYDNALLVSAIADTYRFLQADPVRSTQYAAYLDLFRESLEETLTYVAREMTHENGGFYSAQDADSEGVEGKFFVWDRAEIEQVLGEEAALFCAFYDVSEHGNWEEKNILWRLESFEAAAEKLQMPLAELKERLRKSRQLLFEARSKRIWPGTDTKIVVSWNALMASAYCAAYAALGTPAYLDTATRNVDFLLEHCFAPHPNGPLCHVWNTTHPAFLEDYAYLIAALTDLYELSFDKKYLQHAAYFTTRCIEDFYDADTALFFFTALGQPDIWMRKKDLYDNATPSGNSTMLHNLQRLSLIMDHATWRAMAEKMCHTMRSSSEKFPQAFARWASACMNEIFPTKEIAITGKGAIEKARAIQRAYLPNKVICAAENLEQDLPLLRGKDAQDGALIYICQNYACLQPLDTVEKALEILLE